jgi:RNA polymerase sigma-70 factor, ECF subfamily
MPAAVTERPRRLGTTQPLPFPPGGPQPKGGHATWSGPVLFSPTTVADFPGQVRAGVTFPGLRPRRKRGAQEERAPGEELIRFLYQEHGRSVLAYATRLTGDRAAAEDVVQETLLRAWRHADDLRDESKGSVRGWLLTVARNIVTDRARARASRPQEIGEPVDLPGVELDHAEQVVNSMAVLGALDKLSAEHREVLVEMYYRGRTVTEAAKVLRIPPGTVKSRSYHALRALRVALAGRSGAREVPG